MKILLSVMVLLSVSTAKAYPNRFITQEFPGVVKIVVEQSSSVDVLFIMDNSGSMDFHQTTLSQHAKFFGEALKQSGADYHLGVITTSMVYPTEKSGGRLIGTPNYIDRNTVSGLDLFTQRLLVGTDGDGVEMLFDPMVAALSEPLLSHENAGFLRKDAHLALVFVSDADDQGKFKPEATADFLKNLKGDLKNVSTFAFTPISPDCPTDDYGVKSEKLIEFLQKTGGSAYDLCTANDDEHLGDMAKKLFPASHPTVGRIPLTTEPVLDSIDVRYGTQVLTRGLIDRGWVYDSTKNEVLLGTAIEWTEQPVGTNLEVTFKPKSWTN